MLNGTTGAAAVCCEYSPGTTGAGYRSGSGNVGAGLRGSVTTGPDGKPASILQVIENALNQAIHGGDSGASAGAASGGGGGASGFIRALSEVEFPMTNPYQPVGDAKVPASPQFAWPGAGLRLVPSPSQPSQAGRRGRQVFNAEGDEDIGPPADKETGSESLGFSFSDSAGIALPFESSNPSKLQTIVGGIVAALPATIQAARANPSNIYPGTVYGPYSSNAGGSYPGRAGAGSDIGASAGAAVGNVGDTLGGIVARHPVLTLAGVMAAVLLFMNPPRRR